MVYSVKTPALLKMVYSFKTLALLKMILTAKWSTHWFMYYDLLQIFGGTK